MVKDAGLYTTIGAMIAIAASIFNAIGYTVQKKGHVRLKKYNAKASKLGEHKKRLIKEKVWAIGFGVYLIGGLLNAVSLFYAPQSLVLPLSAITLVANTMLATKILGEPFFKADIFGMLSVITGSVLAVIFGPRTAGGEATMKELAGRWGDEDFFLFFIILSACMVADYIGVRLFEKKNRDDDTVTDELKHGSAFLLISYCLLAGYFGSLAFLFLKSFTEFIGSSFGSKAKADENAKNWYSYFTLIGVVITNFILEFFRQRGLAYFHAVYVVPINQVVLIVMGTILGGLYFEEFDGMPALDAGMFVFAILMTIVGVFILAFNSGNVAEKTTAKINHTITLSLDANINTLPGLPPVPSIIQTSPSMPITRSVNDEVPDLPPPDIAGMAGAIARIHGLHRTMASMHYTKDGKPFYLEAASKLSISTTLGIGRPGQMDIYDGYRGQKRGHTKGSRSVPTYSHSSLAEIKEEPNGYPKGFNQGFDGTQPIPSTSDIELAGMNSSIANLNKMKGMERVAMERVATESQSQQSPHLGSNTSFSNSMQNKPIVKAIDIYHVNGKVRSSLTNNNSDLQGISEYDNGINGSSSSLQAPQQTHHQHQNGKHLDQYQHQHHSPPDQNGKNGTHHVQINNGRNISALDISNPQNGKVEVSDDSPQVTPYNHMQEDSIVIVTKKYTDSAKGSISITNDEVS